MRFTVFLAILFFLTGCGHASHTEEPQLLEVNIQFSSNEVKTDESIVIDAVVRYGDEVVTDATKVMFEIWKDGSSDHEEIIVMHHEQGIYRLEKTFSAPGTYYVITHVDAKRLHTMPKGQFTVTQ
jgi:hypothetical protein